MQSPQPPREGGGSKRRQRPRGNVGIAAFRAEAPGSHSGELSGVQMASPVTRTPFPGGRGRLSGISTYGEKKSPQWI